MSKVNEINNTSQLHINVIGGGVYLKNKPQNITITWEIKDDSGNRVIPDMLFVNNIKQDPTLTSKTFNRVFSDVDFTVRAVKGDIVAIGTTTARFVGPTQTVENSLDSYSNSTALSANQGRILDNKIENATNRFKGLFLSVEDLSKKFKNGVDGDWAIVGESIPAPIFIWNKNQWEASGGNYDGETVDLTAYSKKQQIAEYTDDYNVSKNHQHSVKVYDDINWSTVKYDKHAPVFRLGDSYDSGEIVNMVNDEAFSYKALNSTNTAPYLTQKMNSFTLEEAISFLPEDLRVSGQKISFYSSEKEAWMTYVFTGGDYTNPTYWEIFTNNIDPDTDKHVAELYDITDELDQHLSTVEDNLNSHITESNNKFDEIDQTLEDHSDRMNDIEDEILMSSVEAACSPKDVEILADRAYKDHTGKIIADEYVTRNNLTNEIIDITNQQVTDLKPGSVDPEDLSEATKQLLGNKNITNLPDEEDITVDENNLLKFKDKEYSPKDYSGMGRKVLRKHYVNGVNTLTQHMINKPNTIYIIQYDYCLADQTIEIPENCVLEFEGGSLRNGKLILSNNTIILGSESLFNAVTISINNKSNITISNIVFDNIFYQNNCISSIDSNNINLKNITVNNYRCNFENLETEFYTFYFYNCTDIKIYGLLLNHIYPEGPFFDTCKNVTIDNIIVNDKDNSIWTCLHFFYSENILINNSRFYHKREDGSAINFNCKNGSITNCYFEGGQGIDLSNETAIEFNTENIKISNCSVINANYFLYSYPSDKYIKNLQVSNCYSDCRYFVRVDYGSDVIVSKCIVKCNHLLYIGDIDKTFDNVIFSDLQITNKGDEDIVLINCAHATNLSKIIIDNINVCTSKKVTIIRGINIDSENSSIYIKNSFIKAETIRMFYAAGSYLSKLPLNIINNYLYSEQSSSIVVGSNYNYNVLLKNNIINNLIIRILETNDKCGIYINDNILTNSEIRIESFNINGEILNNTLDNIIFKVDLINNESLIMYNNKCQYSSTISAQEDYILNTVYSLQSNYKVNNYGGGFRKKESKGVIQYDSNERTIIFYDGENWRKITALPIDADSRLYGSEFPLNPRGGQIFYNSNEGRYYYYHDGWTTFDLLKNQILNSGDIKNLSNMVRGQCVFDNVTGKPVWWTGTQWVDATGARV